MKVDPKDHKDSRGADAKVEPEDHKDPRGADMKVNPDDQTNVREEATNNVVHTDSGSIYIQTRIPLGRLGWTDPSTLEREQRDPSFLETIARKLEYHADKDKGYEDDSNNTTQTRGQTIQDQGPIEV